jgi:hypothetical protein
MAPRPWDVYIMSGAMHYALDINMHAVPFAGLAGARSKKPVRNKIQSDLEVF